MFVDKVTKICSAKTFLSILSIFLTKLFQHICNIRQGSQILSIEIKALQRKEWHFQQPLSLRDFYNRFLKCLKHFQQMAFFAQNSQKIISGWRRCSFLLWTWGGDEILGAETIRYEILWFRREIQKRQKFGPSPSQQYFLSVFFSHPSPSHGIMAQQSPRIISTESENRQKYSLPIP